MNVKMQRWTSLILILIFTLSFVQIPQLPVYAAPLQLSSFAEQQLTKAIVLQLDNSITLVDKMQKPLDSASTQVKPIVKSNTTFVPLRFLSENMGAKVSWDQKSQTASVILDNKTIKAVLGQKNVQVNGSIKNIAAPTFQISGRIYVPLRVISEAFGKNVLYSNGIIILSNAKPALDAASEQKLVNELLVWFSSSNMPELTIKQIIQKYDDSVATILVYDYYGQLLGQGTGFYIGNGLFLTNNHVLETGFSYDLYLNNGQLIEAAGVVKYNANKDLAILKTMKIPGIAPVKIGSKSMVEKGDRIMTISSPLGLTNTVSDGLVSSFRNIDGEIDMIQITAPITHGSSGSPLFNMYGYVVGVNTLGYEESGNLNFAVAIDEAAAWINELLAKDFKSLPVIDQAQYASQGGEPPKVEELPQAPIDFDMELDFEVTDAVKHPTKPIIYISDKLTSKLYAVNYETQEQQSISFDFIPENIDFYNGDIFVALLKHQHSSYIWEDQQQGAIAVVDAETLNKKYQFDISTDPFDVVAGRDGNVYVTSGSGQWTDIVSYSLTTKKQIGKLMIRQQSYAAIHPLFNKIYTVDTDSSPRDIAAFSFNNGVFTSYYDSPYHGDYDIGTRIKVSPDGRYLFTSTGTVFTAGQGRDLGYAGKLDKGYNDIAFDLSGNSIYAGSDSGKIDIYDYKTFKSKGKLDTKGNVLFLFYDNSRLIAITKDDNKTLNKIRTGIMFENIK